jgi:protein-disulfide isomerase
VAIGKSPSYGQANAKVTMVMALDFACPFCRRAYDTVEELRRKYGNDLRVVYKAMIVHPKQSTYPALAACAASHQGKWHELADLLWTKSFDAADFSDATIDKLAGEARLDLARYHRDITGSCAQEIKDEQAQMTRLGVSGTPTFYINGRFLAGALPIEKYQTLIDEELAKASSAIQSGVRPERYYDQEIVAKGLTGLAPPTP